ncbi:MULTISPECIES: redoxin domain-containing protein [unclassified Halobacteriovorax]|uniref:redoxin domain-containing protein n=1 Tax=unclassified Halobacteriovorax TaxID=2639665 RepID=UPI000EA3835A|nr:redoxin domain-containing protein [Halobacteriovorax sp. BALOs_7]AYF44779.1 redoxin [Halobacteriovorax sp. BALOs_7]
MKLLIAILLTSLTFALSPGEKAPEFILMNQKGELVSLENLKGRRIVLEWYNEGCPFVRKHYDSKNMQETQTFALRHGYTWLTINSSNVGKQGYIEDSEAAKKRLKAEGSRAQHFLLDTKGVTGRLYNAKTTPEIFIINEQGRIDYMGAIDSIPSADKSDIQKAENYVKTAIKEIAKGEKVSTAKTKPYGCSVKY